MPIMGRVTINGTVAQFSCKCTVPENIWDSKANRAVGRSRRAREVNQTLDDIRLKLIQHYRRLTERDEYVTAEMVRNAYQGISDNSKTLLEAFDRENQLFLRRCGKDRALSSYKVFVRNRNYVADFIHTRYHRKDMLLNELTPDFIREFSIYLTAEHGLKQSTTRMACMQLKGIVTRAHDNGLLTRNPFAQFHISTNVAERAYLTEEELKTLMTHTFEDASLAYCRDLFVFASLTAMSFVDMKELTSDNIRIINGEKWIVSHRHKTKVPFLVKLLDIPQQVIERYSSESADNHIFPNLNYWAMCKLLKRVIALCGIQKPISWHCARHSFATLALSNGMPIESVSRILGHTKISTTQIYAKITTDKLNADLTDFSNKLDGTLNGLSFHSDSSAENSSRKKPNPKKD